jgi:hypothetical protein
VHVGYIVRHVPVPPRKGTDMANSAIPRTKTQKARAWATSTLVVCGAFSIWANVRSGQVLAENVIVSVLPPVVAFLTSHLVSYFSPRQMGHKVMVWGGFGLIILFSMYGSGWHIYTYVSENGQHWTTAIIYVFIVDAPMLLAGVILIEKVPAVAQRAKPATPVKAASKTTSPPKVTTQTPRKKTDKVVPKLPDTYIPKFSEV